VVAALSEEPGGCFVERRFTRTSQGHAGLRDQTNVWWKIGLGVPRVKVYNVLVAPMWCDSPLVDLLLG
jgi:hypothetical protein